MTISMPFSARTAALALSAAALVALATLAPALERTGQTAAPSMQLGGTTTETTAPATLQVAVATPTLTAQRPNGF